MGRVTFAIALAACLVSCRTPSTRAGSPASFEPREMPSGAVREMGPILSYADVVDRVAPAVVTIRSARRVHAPQQFPFTNDPFFGQLFGGRVPGNGNNQRRNDDQVEHALGSGVIITPDGRILTNHHVIDGADDISVELTDRRTYKAKVLGSDTPSDLALLKIDASNLPVLPLGD